MSAYIPEETQVLISPLTDTFQFQNGYLGLEGERATIEGQVQIKSPNVAGWSTVTITLLTTERDSQQSIELARSTVVLFDAGPLAPSSSSSVTLVASLSLPSTMPFSITLPQDTPQALSLPGSSITHELIVTLVSKDESAEPIVKSLTIYPRRYTRASDPHLSTVPYRVFLDSPTRVEAQVPRTTFRIGEPIPIYLTVPPPDRSVILDGGWRLRNVKAELVRVVQVIRDEGLRRRVSKRASQGPPSTTATATSSALELGQQSSAPDIHESILTRSGAACRFHSSRPVRIRLVLHASDASSEHSDDGRSSPTPGVECAITQQTVLHSVDLRLSIHVTFLNSLTHSEHVSNLSIPITLIPAAAPGMTEEPIDFEGMYRKKHDRPPVKTNRGHEDADIDEAGSSSVTGPPGVSAPPPPFEEREAPPPFTAAPAPRTSHPPTFLESESDAIVTSQVAGPSRIAYEEEVLGFPASPGFVLTIPGEGTLFGFGPAEQYDGLSLSFGMSTPPPGVASSSRDTNMTALADFIDQPERALEALENALDAEPVPPGVTTANGGSNEEDIAPPPPMLDDPLDPPPSIDSADYRLLPPGLDVVVRGHPPSARRAGDPHDPPPAIDVAFRSPPPGLAQAQLNDPPPIDTPISAVSTSGGPPPYLIPPAEDGGPPMVMGHGGAGPPPYIDLERSRGG